MNIDKKTNIQKWVAWVIAGIILILKLFGYDIDESIGQQGTQYITELIVLILSLFGLNSHYLGKKDE